MAPKGTYTQEGWLTIGLAGSQNRLGEDYITNASTNLCSTIFLVLGLPPTDEFWISKPQNWTSKHVWEGGHVDLPDKAYKETGWSWHMED